MCKWNKEAFINSFVGVYSMMVVLWGKHLLCCVREDCGGFVVICDVTYL